MQCWLIKRVMRFDLIFCFRELFITWRCFWVRVIFGDDIGFICVCYVLFNGLFCYFTFGGCFIL